MIHCFSTELPSKFIKAIRGEKAVKSYQIALNLVKFPKLSLRKVVNFNWAFSSKIYQLSDDKLLKAHLLSIYKSKQQRICKHFKNILIVMKMKNLRLFKCTFQEIILTYDNQCRKSTLRYLHKLSHK